MTDDADLPGADCTDACYADGAECRDLTVQGVVIGTLHHIVAAVVYTPAEGSRVLLPGQELRIRVTRDDVTPPTLH